VSGRGLLIFTLIVTFAAIAAAGYAFNRSQDHADQAEAQRNAYALCVVQNDNRNATRTNTLSLYRLLALGLKNAPPDSDPAVVAKSRAELDRLKHQLQALRPIDCATYVRPDVPSDVGVQSKP